MDDRVTKCIFCGSPNVSDEHVFSRWTHKYMSPRLPGATLGLSGVSYLDRHDVQEVRLKGAVRDWLVKCVCGGTKAHCNTGWMNDLEKAARPLLLPLILGKHTRLSPEKQETIAAWVALKAMISEYNPGDFVTTRQRHRDRLMRIKKPPAKGWGIWIGHCPHQKSPTEWTSSAFSIVDKLAPGGDRLPSYYNGHSTTQIIKQLFIQVIRGPASDFVERWKFATPDGGALRRIWPPTGYSFDWPPAGLSVREVRLISTSMTLLIRRIGQQKPNS